MTVGSVLLCAAAAARTNIPACQRPIHTDTHRRHGGRDRPTRQTDKGDSPDPPRTGAQRTSTSRPAWCDRDCRRERERAAAALVESAGCSRRNPLGWRCARAPAPDEGNYMRFATFGTKISSRSAHPISRKMHPMIRPRTEVPSVLRRVSTNGRDFEGGLWGIRGHSVRLRTTSSDSTSSPSQHHQCLSRDSPSCSHTPRVQGCMPC